MNRCTRYLRVRIPSAPAAPLKVAEGAVVVDTSALTLEESIERVCTLIAGKLGGVLS